MSVSTEFAFVQSLVTIQEVQSETPERNLLAAVLDRAIRDALGYRANGNETQRTVEKVTREALCWLHFYGEFKPAQLSRPALMSFAWIAKELDLDPEKLRRAVKTFIESTKSYGFPIRRRLLMD